MFIPDSRVCEKFHHRLPVQNRIVMYVSKINIFGLKMMVKSGLGKIILKSLHAQSYFSYFIGIFVQNYKFSNKNDILCAYSCL